MEANGAFLTIVGVGGFWTPNKTSFNPCHHFVNCRSVRTKWVHDLASTDETKSLSITDLWKACTRDITPCEDGKRNKVILNLDERNVECMIVTTVSKGATEYRVDF